MWYRVLTTMFSTCVYSKSRRVQKWGLRGIVELHYIYPVSPGLHSKRLVGELPWNLKGRSGASLTALPHAASVWDKNCSKQRKGTTSM